MRSFFTITAIWTVCVLGFTGCVNESPSHPPERVSELLVILLNHPEPDLRRTAALSLGKIGDPQSITALASALFDQDDEVRQWSTWALGRMPPDSLSEETLVALVQQLTDPSESVRQAAVLALGRRTISEEFMQIFKEAYAISTVDTQRSIIQALSQFDFSLSYPLFLEALQSQDSGTRQSAVAGLGELGDRRALPVLRTHLLQDSNAGVRAEAAFRLGKLGSKADMPALQEAMETDTSPNVHFWAFWAIKQISPNS